MFKCSSGSLVITALVSELSLILEPMYVIFDIFTTSARVRFKPLNTIRQLKLLKAKPSFIEDE